jgi:hypothetical protein
MNKFQKVGEDGSRRVAMGAPGTVPWISPISADAMALLVNQERRQLEEACASRKGLLLRGRNWNSATATISRSAS